MQHRLHILINLLNVFKNVKYDCKNQYFIKNHHWCDFEIVNLKGNLKIGDKSGFSHNYAIQIIFVDVFFQCLYK